MQQLSWTDDMMLRAESVDTPIHIQILLIYDPSTAPAGRVTFKGILKEFDARLHLLPALRRRLTELPGGLHVPYWVDDPNFDLEFHVRHIALPQPGDWRQLCIQIARLHARPVDLRRPPWEMTVIEGLKSVPGVPPRAFAIALKLHHCLVDGTEVVELLKVMHDESSDGPRPVAPASPWRPDPLPSTASLLSRTAINGVLHPVRAGRVLGPSVLRGIRGLPDKLTGGAADRNAGGNGSLFAPKTRFNEAVSPHRVFEARFHDLSDIKRIKDSTPGATVNDVALAYVGGALRKYLSRHGELPDKTLVAFCPISLRQDADVGAGGNMLWGMMQPLQTTIVDPLERLAAIAESTAAYRLGSDHSRSTRRLKLAGTLPTALLGRTIKAASVLPFPGPTFANTVVTNVRGPGEPLFFAGARLLEVVGLGPLIGGLNIFHAVESYNGSFSIGVTADREVLPDPACYAECMEAAFQELLAAAG